MKATKFGHPFCFSAKPAEIKKAKTWSPEDPFLYDIEFSVINKNGETIDKVNSYAGMRKSELRNGVF